MKDHFLRASKSPRFTYNTSGGASNNNSSYSFSNQSIGAADSSRIVVVLVFGSGNNLPTSSSCTVGGVSATSRASVFNASGNAASLFTLPVSSGTTATIAYSFNVQMARSGFSVYSVYNTRTFNLLDGVVDTSTDTGAASSSDLSFTNYWPAGGIFIGGYQVFDNAYPTTRTMSTNTNNTVTRDEYIKHGTENRSHVAASMLFTNDSGTGTETVTCTFDTSRQYESVGAVFY